MDTGEYLASQNLFILISVVALAVVGLLLFLHKRPNREAMKHPDDKVIATVHTEDDTKR